MQKKQLKVAKSIHLIPFISYEVTSSLSTKEIKETFLSSINLLESLSLTKINSYKEFEGVISENKFKFRRISKFGYSAFLPILSCVMREENNQIYLTVDIRFHFIVNMFLSFVIFIILLFLFMGQFTTLILIFPLLIAMFLFNMETSILIEQLDKIINGDSK